MHSVAFEIICSTVEEVALLYKLLERIKAYKLFQTLEHASSKKRVDGYVHEAMFWDDWLVTFEYNPRHMVVGAVTLNERTFKGDVFTLMARNKLRYNVNPL